MKPEFDSKPLNVWNYKPWWCQPWSIILTSAILVGGSWLLLRIWWLTALVAIPVVTWMVFFVLVYPKLMAQNDVFFNEEINEEGSKS